MYRSIASLSWLLGLALTAALFAACSRNNPVDSPSLSARGGVGGSLQQVEFDDVITGIDLVNSSLSVANREETILVDSNTVIIGRSPDYHVGASSEGDNSGSDDDNDEFRDDIVLTLAELSVGDLIEVDALILDGATQLATEIEVEGEASANDGGAVQVEFKDGVASLDTTTRVITFFTVPWVGIVAEDAELRDLNDNLITLAEFFACQFVKVNGSVISGDTISIVRMEMEPF